MHEPSSFRPIDDRAAHHHRSEPTVLDPQTPISATVLALHRALSSPGSTLEAVVAALQEVGCCVEDAATTLDPGDPEGRAMQVVEVQVCPRTTLSIARQSKAGGESLFWGPWSALWVGRRAIPMALVVLGRFAVADAVVAAACWAATARRAA